MTPTGLAGAREALEVAAAEAHLVDLSWLAPEAERGEWTLDDAALRFVVAATRAMRPHRVVEFGSGMSTRVLAAACAGLDCRATVVALENDPVFAARTRRNLSGDPAGALAHVELAHLVVRRWYGRNVPVYDLPASAVGEPAPELVLVDGPPLPLGGRAGSLLQALHLGEAGTLVLLDDANRPSEEDALAMAEKVVGDAIEVMRLPGFAKGLAAVVVRRSLQGSAMPPPPAEGGQP